MAGSSFFALFDDIASLLDDVAAMTKLATKKTAGVLGDDLALNAEQAAGVRADRELPVVWAIGVGSLKNKAILVPLALLISAFLPKLVMPLLMLGGLYLCFEGAEKLLHKWMHRTHHANTHHTELVATLSDPQSDILTFEKQKIKTAIRTDFILSAEIVTITLGSVAGHPLPTRIGVLVGVSLLMTFGVYGLVAGIVKIDDLGLFLHQKRSRIAKQFSSALLWFAPKLMKTLSVAGTAAMFLVGGGILVHSWPWLHETIAHRIEHVSTFQGLLEMICNAGAGIIAGSCVVLANAAVSYAWKKSENN